MQASDILLLLELIRRGVSPQWTVRSLAVDLRVPPAAVQRSLARLDETPVYDAARRRVSWSATEELLGHAVPFVAPGQLQGPTRGVPTAWAAPPLSNEIVQIDELPPVWPAADGEVRGLALEPLHPTAPGLAGSDPWMYEMLALIDGIRIGDARVRRVAKDLLHVRLEARAGA